jgi:HEAT repeat protein
MPLKKRESPAAPTALVPDVDEFIAGLRDSSAGIRRSAARGLAEHPQAAPALCAALAGETQESVREAIFTALIRIGTKAAAEGLVPLLSSEDPGLRNGAIEALKTIPDAAAERIDEILSGSSDVRIFAVEILGSLEHPRSAEWLLQIIADDRELNVCAAAVEALAECGDEAAIAPLRRLLERFPDEPFLEFAVDSAIARIGNG